MFGKTGNGQKMTHCRMPVFPGMFPGDDNELIASYP